MSAINHKLKNRHQGVAALIVLMSLTLYHGVKAAETKQYIQNNCVSCHAISKPDFDKSDITERINRKGPPLYFAGDKFNKAWLESWLEAPYRIRPGGSFPPSHTVVTDEGDVIDEKTLAKHPAVDKPLVKSVVEYLMSLHSKDKPILESRYQPKVVSAALGKMNFNKFKGCAACHRDDENSGGLSGPELYTAWQRLQPEFIVSYIKNPVVWDPHSMMPNRHLQETDIHKLVDYLKLIGEKTP